jgi:hypothetical protein
MENPDPYRKIKSQSTKKALSLYSKISDPPTKNIYPTRARCQIQEKKKGLLRAKIRTTSVLIALYVLF